MKIAALLIAVWLPMFASGKEPVSLSITVAGEVNKPCRVEVDPKTATIKELAELAGGLSTFGTFKRVTVVRINWVASPDSVEIPRKRVFLDFRFPDSKSPTLEKLDLKSGDILVFGQVAPAGWTY